MDQTILVKRINEFDEIHAKNGYEAVFAML